MYDDSSKPPISSSKLIIILLAALVLVMAATVALNGGTSTPPVENVSENLSDVNSSTVAIDSSIIGNNSYGNVVKSSGYGNPSSDIHVAFIVGVDAVKSQNAIVPTIQGQNDLKYCYDIYVVDTSKANKNNDLNNQNNMTANEMSESLAAEYVVPDIIKNNYNFTVDVHSTNDSNSYVFVPSDNTYTSKIVVDSISNNTKVGIYTPDVHAYTESISENIIDYEIPSIVYVTRDYYSNGTSPEVNSIIHAIDNFDFAGLFSSGSTSDDSGNNTYSNDTEYQTINVTSNSSGNKEVN